MFRQDRGVEPGHAGPCRTGHAGVSRTLGFDSVQALPGAPNSPRVREASDGTARDGRRAVRGRGQGAAWVEKSTVVEGSSEKSAWNDWLHGHVIRMCFYVFLTE